MKRILISTVASAGLMASSLVAGASAPAGAATTLPYTVQTLHFKVIVGSEKETCDVVGDLYLPNDASPTNRMPAILTTNGFGGSKNDQAGIGKYGASNGYVVLSYSGLGFGGSGCQITLDDPSYDGEAGSQLVSYLGGAPGIAYLDAAHTKAAPVLDDVTHDAVDHDGVAQKYDPRVGMIGGSYGGEIQFATAADDPRVDTIIPLITWNDLSYSIVPNNANQIGDTLASTEPGDTKLIWGLGFSALGIVDGLQNAQADPGRLIPCPNFAFWVCPTLVYAGATGTLDPSGQAAMKHASVASYMSKIKIPVLLAQGELDTLFNLNEAIANYQALKAQGTPVQMIWQSWGHSALSPQPGEVDLNNPDPATQYETGRFFDWFAHYLKGDSSASTGPGFAYFQDWVKYTGNASPAYATADEYGDFPQERYYLGSSSLTTDAAQGTGSQSFLTAPGGLPTSINPIDVVGSYLPLPETDLPGTFANWTSPTLTQDLDVVGVPVLKLKVSAPLSGALSALSQPVTDLALFIRLQDVAPDGKATDIRQLTAPIRVNPNKAFTVRLPAIVHQFAAGHKIKLIVAGGSINYRGSVVPNLVSIAGGSAQTLDLPTPQLPTPPVTPPAGPQAPSAPASITAKPAGKTAAVSWTAPASNGGSPVTGYSVTCNKGGNKLQTIKTTSTSAQFSGFLNGPHRCVVSATNAAGTSGLTPSAVFTTKVPPTTPASIYIKVSRTAKGRTVHLWWKRSDGNGSKVTYVITSRHHKTVRVTGTSVWLYHLPKGWSTFVVKATSVAGTSRGATAIGIFRH